MTVEHLRIRISKEMVSFYMIATLTWGVVHTYWIYSLEKRSIKLANWVKNLYDKISLGRVTVQDLYWKGELLSEQLVNVPSVPTRWKCTYLMLESDLRYQRAFDRLKEDTNQFSSNLSSGPGKCSCPN